MAFDYQQFTHQVVASSALTELRSLFRSDQLNSYWWIDDVVVTDLGNLSQHGVPELDAHQALLPPIVESLQEGETSLQNMRTNERKEPTR